MDFLYCVIYSRCKHCSTITDSGIGKENFDFKGCLFGKMSGHKCKEVDWHTGWWIAEGRRAIVSTTLQALNVVGQVNSH